MRILLANPPMWQFIGGRLNFNPNLGLMYLASILRNEHEVQIYDFEALGWTLEQSLNFIKSFKPDVLGITGTTYAFPAVQWISRKSKELGIKVVVGGPHATAMPERTLEKTKCDLVIKYEAEEIVLDCLGETGVIGGKKTDVKKLPFPAWDLMHPSINSEKFVGNAPRYKQPESVVMWSRGCPHRCKFCSNPVFRHQPTRFRDPDNIVEELTILHEKYGINSFFVYDDELIGQSPRQNKWLIEVCQKIIKSGLKIEMKCQGRCSPFVTDEVISAMKQAGFKAVMLGCESGSQVVLDAIQKATKPEWIEQTVKTIYNNGLDVWGFWMVQNLKETPEEARKTEELIKKLKPYMKFKQVTIATPWPGSELYEIATKNNWIFDTNLSHWIASVPVMNTPWMSAKEAIYWRNRLLEV